MGTPRPKDKPFWATVPTEAIVPPSAGKRLGGWLADERPPGTFFNWIKNLIGDWIGHQSDIQTKRLRRYP